ncbi:AbiTii domain-containing protein [Bradyrhizobium sp. URHC0002]
MSILREIQAAILQENPDLGTILLKLRFLASRLGSEPLEDWVKYEAEGYPRDADVPEYRVAGLSYRVAGPVLSVLASITHQFRHT